MVTFPYLKVSIGFSLFLLKLGETSENSKTTAEIDQSATDGLKFFKKIVHGDKISEKPRYLMFTAPYRLCEGGCKSDNNNFVLAFPLFVGAKGKVAYRNIYNRDHGKIHSRRPNAPFRMKTTKELITPCPTKKICKDTLTSNVPYIIYEDVSESLEMNTPGIIILDDSPETDYATEHTSEHSPEHIHEDTPKYLMEHTNNNTTERTTEYTTEHTTDHTTEHTTQHITEYSPKTTTIQNTRQPRPSSRSTKIIFTPTYRKHTEKNSITRCPKIFPRICKKKKKTYAYSDFG